MCSPEGVSCYTCTYTSTGKNTDKACVVAPMNVTQGGKVTMCPDSRFCTTYRQYDYGTCAYTFILKDDDITSKVLKFADDTKVFREIRSDADR